MPWAICVGSGFSSTAVPIEPLASETLALPRSCNEDGTSIDVRLFAHLTSDRRAWMSTVSLMCIGWASSPQMTRGNRSLANGSASLCGAIVTSVDSSIMPDMPFVPSSSPVASSLKLSVVTSESSR